MINYNPRIITDGLILHLDAANKKSTIFGYSSSLVDFLSWIEGYNTLPWPSNGDGNQNEMLYDTDPWGNQSLVLKTHPNNSGPNGGWEGTAPGYWNSANPLKLYRFSVWVRRVSTNTSGTFYHGLHTDGAGDVLSLHDSASQGNPYFTCIGIGSFELNQWYLHVGHLYPYGTTRTERHPDSGYWTITGGYSSLSSNTCNIIDCKFSTLATSAIRQRVYHFYSGDPNSNIELAFPRIDLCDGNEPSIQTLLKNGTSQINDLSGHGNNGILINNIGYEDKCFSFHKLNDRITISNSIPRLSVFTIELLMKTSTLDGSQDIFFDQFVSLRFQLVYNRYSTHFGNGSAWIFTSQLGNTTITANTWYHAVWVCNGVDSIIYLNGIQDSIYTYNGGLSGTGTINIGQHSPDVYNNWDGRIASIKIYNRALSHDEIKQNFNASRSRYGI